ncbi:MAG: hypothetical protein ACTHLL_04705 [Candidatus Nitrosocosmicus sp.]
MNSLIVAIISKKGIKGFLLSPKGRRLTPLPPLSRQYAEVHVI